MFKTCKTCLVIKSVEYFYKNSGMVDGCVNHCKDCQKTRIRDRRKIDIESTRASERAYYRQNAAKKNKAASLYQKTRAGKEAAARGNAVWHSKNPLAYAAHTAVGNALKMGTLVKPNSCSRCFLITPSRNLHGHHEDYNKKLDVIWLCAKCHSLEHTF